MEKRNNAQTEITDSGLIIINRLPGWREKLEETLLFLFGPYTYDSDIKQFEGCYVFNKVFNHFSDDREIVLDFVEYYQCWIISKYSREEFDSHGAPIPVKDNYNPEECRNPRVPPFINYLTNRQFLLMRYIDFERGPLLHKTKYHEEYASTFDTVSDEGEPLEIYDLTPDVYCDERSAQKSVCDFINSDLLSLFCDWIDKITIQIRNSHKKEKVNRVNLIMSVFQLYPQIFGCEVFVDNEKDYVQDEYGWYHNKKARSINEGVSIAKDWTFAELKNHNPDEPPQKTLHECHQSSRRYLKISSQNVKTDADRKDSNNDFFRDAIDRYFAPINSSDSLKRLYGEGYTPADKSRYLDWIESWMYKNQDKIRNMYNLYFLDID